MCTHVVPARGVDAIKMVVRAIRFSGYSRMTFKSDRESSILAPLEAVKTELGEACGTISKPSPVGEHQSDGQVENAIVIAQAQVRTMRTGLQSRYRWRIKAHHPIMPCAIHHAAFVASICSEGEDGRTPYKIRRKGSYTQCLNSKNADGYYGGNQ